jgi:toxin ParE1/3/4
LVAAGAERDLADLHGYIAAHDSLTHADDVLDQLMAVVEKLATFPDAASTCVNRRT